MVWSSVAVMSRRSAGTLSPASSSTTSPGTSSRASITFSSPARSALHFAAESLSSASRAFSAFFSW